MTHFEDQAALIEEKGSRYPSDAVCVDVWPQRLSGKERLWEISKSMRCSVL